jgi:hypothetical protein
VLSSRRLFLQSSGVVLASSLIGCRATDAPAIIVRSFRSVTARLPGIPTMDGAGVKLLRVIGQPKLRHLDPFVMMDRFHSNDPSAYIRGFPNHPHRGFETVTVMLSGQVRHADSRGNKGLIIGGGSQWMTAGRGIVHSEMPEAVEGFMSGFQLWVNLPAKEKMCPQFYQDLQPAQLAENSLSAGGKLRVIAGNANGLIGPVRERPTQPTLATVALEDDQPFELETPEENNAFVFVASGEVDIGGEGSSTRVGEATLAVLGSGKTVRVRAKDRRATLLVASGKPINEPIVQSGPFVMNTQEEIEEAWAEYRAGILDKG